MSSSLATVSLLLAAVACDVAGQVFFKLGMNRTPVAAGAQALLRKVLHSPWVALGVAVYALEFVLWFTALARTQLSIAYPFLALGYVGVVLASRCLLGERVSARRWLGIAAIVAGVALVAGPQLG